MMTVTALKYILPCAVFTAILIVAASFTLRRDEIKFIVPAGWPQPAYDFAKNKITPEGFILGRKLFFDPALSGDGTISCASCHLQSSGFARTDARRSRGIHGRVGNRNPPSLFNLAWNTSFMWDGGINNLEVQPLAPITSQSEMDNTLENVITTLRAAPGYKQQFYNAFGDSAITGQRILKAIAQFTVLLESYNSRYDKYMRQEPGGYMSSNELHGLELFRANCGTCHTEPLFTNYTFQNNGLPLDTALNDVGRMKITGRVEDSLKFKVPSLRNVCVSYPYMHDGRFSTLQQVLDHYAGLVPGSSVQHTAIALTYSDRQDIIAFLHTLTDDEFISDSRLGLLHAQPY